MDFRANAGKHNLYHVEFDGNAVTAMCGDADK